MIDLTLHITLLTGFLISGMIYESDAVQSVHPVTLCDQCIQLSPIKENGVVRGSIILRPGPGPCEMPSNNFDKHAAEIYVRNCINKSPAILKL